MQDGKTKHVHCRIMVHSEKTTHIFLLGANCKEIKKLGTCIYSSCKDLLPILHSFKGITHSGTIVARARLLHAVAALH